MIYSARSSPGELQRGAQIPAEIDLREQYEASRNTIRDRYRDSIAVRAPDDAEVALKLPADGRVSVFEIIRVGFDTEGNRFRLTVTVYPSDRNRFRVDVGEVVTSGDVAREDGTA